MGSAVPDMKVIRKQCVDRGISVGRGEIPKPKPDEVLIKIRMVGICGTDLHIYQWDAWSQARVKPPVIIGHEFVGEVYELGSNVKHLQKGQRVSAEGHITCGYCRYCRNGQGHVCQDVEIIGVDRDGCFAEFLCVPAANVWPVHPNIPDKYAALFDPLGNAMHTVMAQSVSMKNVLITGAGSIGLFSIPIAKANGAEKIIVVEPNPMKQRLAREAGADYVIHPEEENVKDLILKYTDGFGPDVLLEMSGNDKSLRMGLDVLCNGGSASLLGIPAGEIAIDLAEEVIFKGITIHGITGRRMYETWYQCESFLLKHGSSIEPIITHVMDLDDVEQGFLKMEKGEAAKVLLKVS